MPFSEPSLWYGVVHAIMICMKTTRKCPICKMNFTRTHTRYKPPRYCSRACANKAPGRMTKEIKERIGKGFPGPIRPNFKGGWKTRGGKRGSQEYFFTWVPHNERYRHPTVNKRGYIHRSHYVWNNAHPGDPVQSGQVIHHLNGRGLDDRLENLEKVSNQSEHMNHHARKIAVARKRDHKGRFV